MSKRGLDIASLTPEERLDLLEKLWDSLGPAHGIGRKEIKRKRYVD